MDFVDAARVGTIVHKGQTPWKVDHLLKTQRGWSVVIHHKLTHQPKVISSEEQWNELNDKES